MKLDGWENGCKNCKYYECMKCRRHAPRTPCCSHGDVFPRVSTFGGWCGDWEKKKSDNDILNKFPIDFNFDVRVLNIFEAAGIKTMEDLVNTTEKKLFEYRNCGKTSLMLIRKELSEHGLSLKAN